MKYLKIIKNKELLLNNFTMHRVYQEIVIKFKNKSTFYKEGFIGKALDDYIELSHV